MVGTRNAAGAIAKVHDTLVVGKKFNRIDAIFGAIARLAVVFSGEARAWFGRPRRVSAANEEEQQRCDDQRGMFAHCHVAN